jgi:hypothetical protein
MVRKLIALVVVLGMVAPALADDLFPPEWRGQPGTTLQHWTFDYYQTPNWIPEFYDNPYGEPYMNTYYGDEVWYEEWEGRQGVVNPWANDVYLNLPNSEDPLEWKIVWVQMTWWYNGEFLPPEFLYSEPGGDLVYDEHYELENGWFHSVYEIWIPGNPNFELVAFASDHYFDQIIVDTWCTPAPGALALIGVAGLLGARRRR